MPRNLNGGSAIEQPRVRIFFSIVTEYPVYARWKIVAIFQAIHILQAEFALFHGEYRCPNGTNHDA